MTTTTTTAAAAPTTTTTTTSTNDVIYFYDTNKRCRQIQNWLIKHTHTRTITEDCFVVVAVRNTRTRAQHIYLHKRGRVSILWLFWIYVFLFHFEHDSVDCSLFLHPFFFKWVFILCNIQPIASRRQLHATTQIIAENFLWQQTHTHTHNKLIAEKFVDRKMLLLISLYA